MLESEICRLAGHLAAATCRFLVLLAEFDARRGWATWDMPSCAAWLSWKCQLSSGTAREHVRVARALGSLPVIQGEFAAGRLSFAKVRALTRIADAESDAELAEMAGPMTANQLERFARAHRTVTRSMDEQARLRRRLTWRIDDDGSLSLSVRLPPEDGAAVLTALRAVTEDTAPEDDHDDVSAETRTGAGPAGPGPGAGVSAETRPTSTSLADALVEIAEAYIAGKTRTAQNPDVYQVIIHATPDALIPDSDLDGPNAPAAPTAEPTVAPGTSGSMPSRLGSLSGPGNPSPPPTSPPSPSVGRGRPAGSHAPGGHAGRCHVEDGPAIGKAALQRIACDAVWSWISHNQQHGQADVPADRRQPALLACPRLRQPSQQRRSRGLLRRLHDRPATGHHQPVRPGARAAAGASRRPGARPARP